MSSMHRIFRDISSVISSNWRVYPSPAPWNPRGARQYLYRAHSVMYVEAFRAVGDSGRLWYPFHASRTVVLVCAGIIDTWLNGYDVWCVSPIVVSFSFYKSTVLLGDPSFFGATTIFGHQVVGVPTCTGSIIPRATSLSSSAFTLFFQWWGTGIGEFTAPGINSVSNGLPSIVCSGWCGHVLNALDLNYSSNHWWSLCILAWIGLNGMAFGIVWTGVLWEHPHGAISFAIVDELLRDNDIGKSDGTRSRSFNAVCD